MRIAIGDEEDLAALYDESPCGCISTGRDGFIVKVNQTFLNWTGYTREALLNQKRFTDLLSVPGRIFCSTQFTPLLQMQGYVKEVAFDINCIARSPLPVLLNAIAKKDEAGKTLITHMTVFDATQRRQYERQLLQASKNAERMTAIVACSGDAVFSFDKQNQIDSWNAGAERLFGKPAAAVLKQSITAVIQPVQIEKMTALFERVSRTSATEAVELDLQGLPGRELSVAMTVSVVRDALDRVTGLYAVARDVTDRREAQERLLHASLHDSLTELPNRVLFADRVMRCIERQRREPTSIFSILSLDLDRFQTINDSLGHEAGDRLLMEVAELLRACIDASFPQTALRDLRQSVVARLGGDEFAILLENLQSADDALNVAEQIGEALKMPHVIEGHDVFASASIGVAFGSAEYQKADDIMRDADAAMHRAKVLGKARFAVFDAEMHRAVVAKFTLENNLRRALERDELLLYYQPLISLADNRLHGFEALVRWRCDGKLISPAEFIPIAEEMGLIVPIGHWVLNEACAQLARWQTLSSEAADLTMAINISRKQLLDPDLIQHIERSIATHQLDPRTLKMEITESVIMERGDDSSLNSLAKIKQTGVLLAMDDFGTGYSSLSCLHQFPIDVLKLDKSFIDDIGKKRGASAVVAGVINLARGLGLTVVAEGIETPDQVAFLKSLNCDIGQGYTFAKPLPSEAAERYILSTPQLARSA